MLAVAMLLYAGCSNHPPSAAQFMNMNKKLFGFGSGGTLRAGDLYGGDCGYKYDDYNCVEETWDLDFTFLTQMYNVVFGLSLENITPSLHAGYISQYIWLQGWTWLAIGAVNDEMPLYGGLMLIENFPITEKLSVGISEHISRNVYKVDENLGGLSFWSADFFWEYGIGAYVSFWGFSLEFRYGREIGTSNNRFNFMLNYLFGLKEKTAEYKKAYKQYVALYVEMVEQKKRLKWLIQAKNRGENVSDEEIEEETRRFRELIDAVDQQKMKVRELKKR